GVDGFLRWQYNDLATGSGNQWSSQFEPFGLVDGKLVVRDSLYWGYAALTRWTTPGSAVIKTQVSGSEDKLGTKRVEAVTLKSPSGFETVLLVNSGRSKKSVILRWKGIQVDGSWKHFYYDRSLPTSILEGRVTRNKRNELTIEVPAESINVITNCKIGLHGDAPR
ncbi:MAG: hypothetical protein N3B12_08925, partial [Armatimonadetes bacterium]|nr:hypothetical protein [Armatimonadota bacterium]